MLRPSASYLLIAIALSWAPKRALGAQFCYECYRSRTIHQLVDSAPELPDSGFVVRGNDHPSRVLVIYTGKKRPITPDHATFIHYYYDKTFHRPLPVQFDDELLFLEDSVEFWLPVQSQLVPYFERELTPGQQVWLFIVWPGGTVRAKRPDWVLLVNEFRTP